MRIHRAGLILLAAASIAAFSSCGKDEQETQKFDRADVENFQRDMSEVSSFKLANGITVYLQEERTDNQVAIEVLYHAGYAADPKGLPQLSHLTEHLAMHCASGPYEAEGGLAEIGKDRGMLNAEAVSEFIHIDYVVKAPRLDMALGIEAERLKGLRCDQETMDREAKKANGEIEKTLADPKGALNRFAMMTLVQALLHGETRVQTEGAMSRITIDDAHRFHQTYYRPDDMVMVLIGNFKKAEAEAMVRKHFESIPGRPTPAQPKVVLRKSARVTWDIDGSAAYVVSPGPFESYKERMILSMFGAYFQQMLNQSPEVYSTCQAVYCSNQVYRVATMPFFIFVQPKQGFTNDDVVPIVRGHLEQALSNLDDKRIESIKTGMVSFATSTMLKKDVPDYPLMHHQVIGQEALNVGIKHILREGRSTEEFVAEIQAITADEVRAALAKHLDSKALFEVAIVPGR